MSTSTLVLWAKALTRAWRGARSHESRVFFAQWGETIAYEWNMNRFRKIKRLLEKTKVAT